MEEKRFVLPAAEPVSVAPADADRLIAKGDGNAALLYLYILRQGGALSMEGAAIALGLTPLQVEAAFLVLSELGLVARQKQKPVVLMEQSGPPEYTADDVAREIGRSSTFQLLVGETQRRLGKVLSNPDLMILLELYDHLGLPVEVISLLITHCIDQARARYGSGRMPTMRQIEKEAYYWSENGIDTVENAAAHLQRAAQRRSLMGEVMQILQISGRSLSKSEEAYVTAWIDMGFGQAELELAYDKTVLNTGSLSWRYMDSILKKWHEKGLHTVSEIKEKDRPASRYPKGSGQLGPHEKDAIEWLKNYSSRQKER